MKRGQEDLLVRLAFGDLSVEESAALEMRARQDPEMAKTLQSYRSLRAGLRDLAEIPEHQLSNERLRDALLGQGLIAGTARARDLSWIWASALACALVAGMFVGLGKLRSHPTEVEILGGVADAAKPKPTDFPGLGFISRPPHIVAAANPAPKARPMAPALPFAHGSRVVAYHHPRHHSAYRIGEGNLVVLVQPREENTVSPSPASADSTAPSTNPVEVASLKPVGATPAGDVVLIDTQKDESTGTRTATEVTSANDVVVGG